MLRVLRIENIAVAREVEIELGPGFSVLTGETGAGKSILLDGLALALGERLSRDMIRPGEKNARVTAIFSDTDKLSAQLEELGIEPDSEGEIEIRRTFSDDGHSTAKVNSRSVPVTVLRDLAGLLVNINSQSDAHAAGDKTTHREILDSFSGLEGMLADYSTAYEEYTGSKNELDELKNTLRDKEMMTDILKYQVKEIDAAKLSDPDEEEKLEKLRLKLKDIEKIAKYTSIVVRALSQNEKGATASYMLERAQSAIEQLSSVMDNADELAARLESIRYELIDIAEQAQDLVGGDMDDPERKLDQVETRLALIAKLEKKYGADIPAVIEFRNNAASKLAMLESGDVAVRDAENKVEDCYKKAYSIASEISKIRHTNADTLSAEVAKSLRFLDMPKALFDIRVNTQYDTDGKEILTPNGFDDIVFMFTANSGYPMKELTKVASGGELSRTMLALKCALSGKQNVGTVVFDEIDTGVSGATSERIGLKLLDLAKNAQVICVTHSPQVAALCDSHYLIKKTEIDGKAESSVRQLDDDERAAEIARIIGGVEVTESQLAAAKEMIRKK